MKFVSAILSAALVVSATTASRASIVVESSGTGVSAVTQSGNVGVELGSAVENRTRLVVAGGRGAETVIRYDDGCAVTLKPGQVYTVLDQSPCAAQASQLPSVAPTAAATGLAGGIGATAVVGVVVAGAIAGGVVAATSGKGASAPTNYISP